jgi:cellulose synthase/poly-beta-1,6-N-acetylglucosamine synthase-like glycosyltransferase
MAKLKKGKKIFLSFFILAIVLSVLRSFCLSLFWPLYCLCFDPFAFLYFGHCIVCASIFLPFFILAIVLSVLRSFCLSLFWPLYCLCFVPFAFLYFGHCIVCASIFLPFFILAKHRQDNGQNKERQKDRSTDNTMAKIKKGKKIEAQTLQWPK